MTTQLQRDVDEGRYETVLRLPFSANYTRDEVDDARFRVLDGLTGSARSDARVTLNQASNELLVETPETRACRHASIAIKLFTAKQAAAASPYAASAVELQPMDAHLRMLNGMVLFEQEKLHEAKAQFREAAQLGEVEAEQILAVIEVALVRQQAGGLPAAPLSRSRVPVAPQPTLVRKLPQPEPAQDGVWFWKLVAVGTLAAFVSWALIR